MKKTDIKRQLIIEKLADYLLGKGLRGASLRPLADAAGMSDRMLLHYFSDKEELMTATLLVVSKRLEAILNAIQTEPLPFPLLVAHLAGMIKDPHIRPYLKLWLELAASAAGEELYYRTIAQQICDSFFSWILSAIKVEREDERRPLAALAFSAIEGLVLLDTIGSDSIVTSALEGLNLR